MAASDIAAEFGFAEDGVQVPLGQPSTDNNVAMGFTQEGAPSTATGSYSQGPRTAEGADELEAPSDLVWSKPFMNGSVPEPRGGHTAVLAGHQLIVFGGHYYGGRGRFEYLNDTHVLDVETSTWHNVRCAGDIPAARFGHSATLVGVRMFVFGGRGADSQNFKDVFFLDLVDWCWVAVNATTVGPSARFGHAHLLVGNKIVVFGGWDGRRAFNDLWVFDTDAFTWIKPRTAGTPPSPRQGHSMQLLPDGRILIFGGFSLGEGGRAVYHKDTRELDTETMVWSRPRVSGEYPCGRFGQSMAFAGHKLYLFGGWTGVKRCILCNVVKEGRTSQPALEHQPDCVVGKSLYGITNDFEASNSEFLHTLDVETLDWERPVFSGPPPVNRYGHSCTLIGRHLFIFGGWDGNQALNELIALDLGGAVSGGL